jgi:hypothetical protein
VVLPHIAECVKGSVIRGERREEDGLRRNEEENGVG